MNSHSLPFRRFILAAAGATLLPFAAQADVSLPALFSEHMVLQRDQPVPVWGWAEAGEAVSVSIGRQAKNTKADANGKWSVKLDKLSAGEPTTLTVKGKNTISVSDVLVGEVWLCSGQSNMEFVVQRANDFEKEKAAAALPKIRMFTVSSGPAAEPQDKCQGKWVVCAPETVGGFSAAGFFFGRELHAKLKVPVGLIHSSVGGTPIEAWTSMEAQKDLPELKPLFTSWEQRIASWNPTVAREQFEKQKAAWETAAAQAKTEGKPAPPEPRIATDPGATSGRPGNLFNGKIAPLIPYALRGAIWYQGESNADTVERGLAYRKQLPLLIADWRKRWAQVDFPFGWVQLPEYVARNSDGWALVQEAMLATLKVPRTGMAEALGLGDAHDIHPKAKQEVGRRLALWALAKVYGQKGPASGPLYAGSRVTGSAVTIGFTDTDGGLVAKDGAPKGFVIAGADKQWKPATAKITGDKVVVSSAEVKAPVAVRYAWGSNPEFNLFNGAGLPASPFRTDDWAIAPAAPPKP
ncbi:MAG: sialate O-acetylesterase [Chthoniobacter sp.]|jgi:sialate O-acetylesterase|nr:sialate O-acetylesterase [Chthoniobacter sp.]